MKLGIFLGVLAGSAAAGVLLKTKRAEAPGVAPAPANETEKPPLKEALDRVRQRANEAIEAAQRASDEKESELRGRYEQLKKGG